MWQMSQDIILLSTSDSPRQVAARCFKTMCYLRTHKHTHTYSRSLIIRRCMYAHICIIVYVRMRYAFAWNVRLFAFSCVVHFAPGDCTAWLKWDPPSCKWYPPTHPSTLPPLASPLARCACNEYCGGSVFAWGPDLRASTGMSVKRVTFSFAFVYL